VTREIAWSKHRFGPIGIDLGNHTMRVVQVSRSRQQTLVSAVATRPSSTRALEPGEWFEANQETLAELLREGRFRGKHAVFGLDASMVRIKNFRLPAMPQEELDRAVVFEARERFPHLGDEPEIRYFNAGKVNAGQGEQFELVVCAVPGELLRGLLAGIRGLNLTCAGLELASAAAFRCFERFLQRSEDANAVHTFLDIGYAGTRLLITRGTDVVFLKSFDTGLRQMYEAVGKALSLDPADAHEVTARALTGPADASDGANEGSETKADSSSDDPGSEVRPAVLEALKPDLEQLSKDIGLCTRYFTVTFRGGNVDSMTCIGGGARYTALLEQLESSLSLPMRVGHPFRNLVTDDVFTGADRRSGQPEWAAALGLALSVEDRNPEEQEAVVPSAERREAVEV
jgi:type IV pilus assembly protein PilM